MRVGAATVLVEPAGIGDAFGVSLVPQQRLAGELLDTDPPEPARGIPERLPADLLARSR